MQSRSENPLTLAYWIGVTDARPLALFRISLGIVLLQDLWARSLSFSFLTDDGVYPRSLLPRPWEWSLFNLSGDALPLMLLFAGGTIVTAAFTFGYFTRAATVLSWLFWLSLHRRIPPIHTGGDGLIDILLFFGIFTDLAGRWSVDALRRGAHAEVRAFAPRCMQLVPALLYLCTAREKLLFGGHDWFFGPIIYKHMHMAGFIRPLGIWLGQHPRLCGFFTGATIITEIALPFLFLLPFWIQPARALAVACHVGLQLGILFTMKVGVFTNVMLATTPLWFQPEWLDAVGGWFRRKGSVDVLAWNRRSAGLSAVLAVLFIGTALQPMVPAHLPRFLGFLVNRLGLIVATRLFTTGMPSVRWEASGLLADQRAVDPLTTVTSGALQEDWFFNTPWMQLPYRLDQYAPLGRFVCRRYNNEVHAGEASGPTLVAWTLTRVSRAAYAPGEPPPVEERQLLWQQDCRSP